MHNRLLISAAAMAFIAGAPLALAKEVKIGFVTTLTGPASIIGKDMKGAVEVALDHINHKIAGMDAKVIFADDGLNPTQGRQKTDKLLRKDKVDILTGYIWSHVLAASSSVAFKANKILISANAGYSPLAGKKCHKNFFSASWENSQTPMAMGELLNQKGVKSLYVLAPNYAAGKDMINGVARTYKGKIVGRDLTAMKQTDWSAELSKIKAAKPEGVFVFYPGAWGPKFLTQYQQAGLFEKIPFYSVFTIDNLSLPFFQKAGIKGLLGTVHTNYWSPDMDNPQNKRFVTDFKKKMGRYPAQYAAQSYDAIMAIKAAVEDVGGKVGDIDAMRAALMKANYASIRGKLRYGANHFPIQNYYAREVVVDKDGKWTTAVREVVLKDHVSYFAKDCNMK